MISTSTDLPRFKELLKDGSQFGIKLSYKEQPSPDGLAQAFIIGEEFIGDDNVCMILGDNIFYGNRFTEMLNRAKNSKYKATIFGQYVLDPERFGVIEFDKDGNVISLEEKPKQPRSNYAAVGLYFYDNRVVEFAKKVKPSARGELEITDLNKMYLELGDLQCELFGRGFAWLDTGEMNSLFEAANFVKIIEDVQGIKISVPEEIAYNNKWITKEQLLEAARIYGKSSYGKHLRNVANASYFSQI